tara:strand:+ start:79 stop:768 length:690 start_codon:yes stop_codon:yes gene_type:complete
MINLSVIVPIYNEEKLLVQSVNRLLEIDIFDQIILVDNNSTDNSFNFAQNISDKNSNVNVFKSKNEQGKGVAVLSGLEHVLTSHVVIHDADLEYFPIDIIDMFNLSRDYPNDLILGSRVIGDKLRKNVYLLAKLANYFLSFLFSILNRVKVTDIASCYKLMPVEFLKDCNLKQKGFGIDLEIVSNFIKSGRKIIEIPIRYEGRSFEQGKKISSKDFFKYVINIFKFRFT